MSGPVLMRAKTSIQARPGSKKRQSCGSRCYNAKNPVEHCVCPCAGINHGVGLAKAVENTKAMQAANADVIFNEKEIAKAEALVAEVVTESEVNNFLITEALTQMSSTPKSDTPADPTKPLRDAKGHFIKRN